MEWDGILSALRLDPLAAFLFGILGGIFLLIFVEFLIMRAYWRLFEVKKPFIPEPPPDVAPHPVRMRAAASHATRT